MIFEIKLDKKDWYNFQSYLCRTLSKKGRTWIDNFWVNIGIWIVIGFLASIYIKKYGDIHWPTFILVAILVSIFFALNKYSAIVKSKVFDPSSEGTFCGLHTFTLSEFGIESKGQGYVSQHSWDVVKHVERQNDVIIIFIDTAFAYVFPESKLKDPDLVYNFTMEQFNKSKVK